MRLDSLSLNHLRMRLAHLDALPQWVLLGLLSGLLTAGVIIAFRHALELPVLALQAQWGYGAPADIPAAERWLLPLAGALTTATLLGMMNNPPTGITHVLERLSYHQGRLPLRNLAAQFFGGVLMLGSGHSGGREGPAVHLGAAVSSLFGQRLQLPNNSLRTLVACGTAAAIASSFNTPLAGVVFAMEVVVLEYSLIGFIPVMVAAVTATLCLQLALGDEVNFVVPALDLRTLDEIPYVVAVGVVVGLLAVAFNRITLLTARASSSPLLVRMLAAGAVVGITGSFLPEVMGLGYDSLGRILGEDPSLTISFLVALTLAKVLVTGITIGLGAPVGLIGPTLVMGGAAGYALGMVGGVLAEQPVAEPAFYALLGMGAMMAATLQAPLAALLGLLELTLNAHITFPAMVAIITSTLCYRVLLNQGSLFHALLEARGLDWRAAPLDQYLERTSVLTIRRQVVTTAQKRISRAEAERIARQPPDWLVIDPGKGSAVALRLEDLRLWLARSAAEQDEIVDLMEIPALRRDLYPISMRATLREALQEINARDLDALLIADLEGSSLGLALREDIERQFRTTEAR